MPWDGVKYYRAVRRGGKPTRVYVASGPLAEMAAEADALARLLKEEARQDAARALAEAHARAEALGEGLDVLDRLAGVLFVASMLAAGFHRPRREWRLKRP